MNIFGFIVRSIVYYRRRNVGLFLTAVVSAAVLACLVRAEITRVPTH